MDSTDAGDAPAVEPWLLEILACPQCRARLRLAGTAAPELECTACGLVYRIDDGVPVLLVDEARAPGA